MENCCIVLLIILLAVHSLCSETTPFEEQANLVGYGWDSWARCTSKNCQWERNNTCVQTAVPHVECQSGSWREQDRNCRKCTAPGKWYLKSVSECEGDTCENRIQTRTYACSDHIHQPGCEKIYTRFCNQAQECDGTWGSWQSYTPCIKSTASFVQIRKRFCMKTKTRSWNCAKTVQMDQTDIVTCDPSGGSQISWQGTTSSTTTEHQPDPTTTKQKPASTTTTQHTASTAMKQQSTSATTKYQPASTKTTQQAVLTATKQQPASTTTTQQIESKFTTETNVQFSSITETFKLKIPDTKLNNRSKQFKNPSTTTSPTTTGKKEAAEPQLRISSSAIRDYVFVIQSIIIVVLLGIILYLVCYIKRRKKKSLPFEVATSKTDPSTIYNQLKFQNSILGSESECEHMLPRAHIYRASCPNLQLPLPLTPSTVRPTKPPRRHRPASEPRITFSKDTNSKKRLTLPASSHASQSAPASPTDKQSLYENTNIRRRSSLQSTDDLGDYVKPFN